MFLAHVFSIAFRTRLEHAMLECLHKHLGPKRYMHLGIQRV